MAPLAPRSSHSRGDGALGALVASDDSLREVSAYQPVLDSAGSAEPSEDADSVKRSENCRWICALAFAVTVLSVLGYVAFAAWQMVEEDTPEVKDHMLQPAHQASSHRHHLKFPPSAPHPTVPYVRGAPGDEIDCEALPRAHQTSMTEIPRNSMGRMDATAKVEDCSNSSEDCSDTRCCAADGYSCYRKHQTYAGCRKTGTCVTGHPYTLDPPELRTPWSCEDLAHLSQVQVRRDQEELAPKRKALVMSPLVNLTSNEREWCCHHKNIGCPTFSTVVEPTIIETEAMLACNRATVQIFAGATTDRVYLGTNADGTAIDLVSAAGSNRIWTLHPMGDLGYVRVANDRVTHDRVWLSANSAGTTTDLSSEADFNQSWDFKKGSGDWWNIIWRGERGPKYLSAASDGSNTSLVDADSSDGLQRWSVSCPRPVQNVYKDLLMEYGYGSCADGDGNNYDSWWATDLSRGSCQFFCDDYEECVGYDFDVEASADRHNVCELRFGNGSMPHNTHEAFAGRWDEGFGVGDVKGVQADGSTRVCYKKMPQVEEGQILVEEGHDTETTAEPSGGNRSAGVEVSETTANATIQSIPDDSSLFCFTLFTAYEEELLVAALRSSAGIFACEGSAVYSNTSRTIRDPDSEQIVEAKIVNVDLSCTYGTVWLPEGTYFQTAFNTPVFIAVWSQVVADGDFRNFGWTVKADGDTVFFPDRLRLLISDNHYSTRGANGRGVFFNNCKLGLHGPIEVLSSMALEEWDANHSRCEEPPEEDVYLQQCMVKLEVEQVDRTDLLAEKGCYRGDWFQNPNWNHCDTGEISFHPFKQEREWLGCFERATAAERVRLLLRMPKSHANSGQSLFDKVAGTVGLVAKAEKADGSTLMLA